MKRALTVFLVLLVLFGSFIVWLGMKKTDALKREQSLNQMMGELDPGDSPGKVREIFVRHRTHDMMLNEVSSNTWLIEEPSDWTTRPANLYVDFTTGSVSHLRIRFHDNTNMKPHEARNDKP